MCKPKEEVEETMVAFVVNFVRIFETYVSEYYERLTKGINKPGKFAEFFGKFLESGRSGCEGFESNGTSAISLVGINILHEALNGIGNIYNKKQLQKLLHPIFKFKKNSESAREELVYAGIDIFRAFEIQIMKIAAYDIGEVDMRKLTHDAVTRVFSYCRKIEKDRKEFTSEVITKGLVFGKSKRNKAQCTGLPLPTPGHTVLRNSDSPWKTADLFSNIGLLTLNDDGTVENFYKLKGLHCGSKKYGCRLPFQWEDVNLNYEVDHDTRFPNYLYLTNVKDVDSYFQKISMKINSSGEFDKSTTTSIRSIVNEHFTELEEIINENFDHLKSIMIQNHSIILESITEIKVSVEQTRQDVLNRQTSIKKLLEKKSRPEVIINVHKKPKSREPTTPTKFPAIPSTALYVERDGALSEITNSMKETGVVVISGLAGVGKSELARKYAQHVEFDHFNIFWINCQTPKTIQDSFQKLADIFEVTVKKDGKERDVDMIAREIFKIVYNQSNLLIFDDAQELSTVENLLPVMLGFSDIKCYVLITSTANSEWQSPRLNIKLVNVKGFSPDEAHIFVRKILKDDKNLSDQDISTFVGALEYHPLALHNAANYIKQANYEYASGQKYYSVSDYLKEYENKPIPLIKTGGECAKTFYRTFEMTFEKIESEEYGEKAIKMIDIISYFMPNNIPITTFMHDFAEDDPNTLNEMTKLLRKYSIITLDDGKWSIPGLVQKVRRTQIKEKTLKKKKLGILKNKLTAFKADKEEVVVGAALRLFTTRHGTGGDWWGHLLSVWNHAHQYKPVVKELIIDSAKNQSKSNVISKIMEESSDQGAEALARCISPTKNKRLSWNMKRSVYIPLKESVKRNDAKIVKLLMPIVEPKSESYKDLLSTAARKGNPEIVKMLVESASEHRALSPVDENTALLEAAECGHVGVVKYLTSDLDNKMTMHNREDDPLRAAIKNGRLEVVKYLVEDREFCISEKDCDGATFVHLACKEGHIDVLKYLVEKDFDFAIKVSTKSGWTPLHFAAHFNHVEIVKYLIGEHDANFSKKDLENGKTPIHVAASEGHLETLKEFFNTKLDNFGGYNETDNFGQSILHLAASGGFYDMVSYLVAEKNMDILKKDVIGRNCGHIAAENGHLELLKYFCSMGFTNLNTRDLSGRTLLHLAAGKGNCEAVKHLVDREGASLIDADNDGSIAAHYAAQGSLVTVKFLIEKKNASFFVQNTDGWTPLHFATASNNYDIVKYLVDTRSVELLRRDESGLTAMHFAAFHGRLEILKLLCDQFYDGGGCMERDNWGRSILHLASEYGQFYVVKYLVTSKRGCVHEVDLDGSTSAQLAAREGHVEVLKYLIEVARSNIEAIDKKHRTCLHNAALFNQLEVFKYLLDKKDAKFLIKDILGRTCAHLAAQSGHSEILKHLYQSKLDDLKGFQLADSQGYTLMHLAAGNGRLETVKYLVEKKGANVKDEDNDGLTVLHMAATHGHLNVLKYLIDEKGARYAHFYLHPILSAAAAGKVDIVEYFANTKKTDLTLQTKEGDTALSLAIKFKQLEVVRFIMQNSFPKSFQNKTLLRRAGLENTKISSITIGDMMKRKDYSFRLVNVMDGLDLDQKLTTVILAAKKSLADTARIFRQASADVIESDFQAIVNLCSSRSLIEIAQINVDGNTSFLDIEVDYGLLVIFLGL